MPTFLPCLPKQPPASTFSNRPFDWSTLTRSTLRRGVASLAPKSLLRALRPFTWPPGEAHPCTVLLSLPSYGTGGCKPAHVSRPPLFGEKAFQISPQLESYFSLWAPFSSHPSSKLCIHTHTHTHTHTHRHHNILLSCHNALWLEAGQWSRTDGHGCRRKPCPKG